MLEIYFWSGVWEQNRRFLGEEGKKVLRVGGECARDL